MKFLLKEITRENKRNETEITKQEAQELAAQHNRPFGNFIKKWKTENKPFDNARFNPSFPMELAPGKYIYGYTD